MATIRNDRDKSLQAATIRGTYDTSITLGKYNAILAASTSGVVGDNSVGGTSVTIKVNSIVDTTWTLSVVGTGCTAHISSSSVVFDGFDIGNTTDSCSYVVTAAKTGYTSLTATMEIVRVRAGTTPSELNLTPSQISLAANYKGDVTNYVDAKSIAKVTTDSTDVTVDWTLSKEDSTGIITKLTGTEIQVMSSVGTQDSDCLYALDFDTIVGTLTSGNIIDTSPRRRKSTLGVDNVTYTAAYLPITISTSGPLSGIKSAVLTSDATGASCIRSSLPSGVTETDDLVNYLQKSFAISMYVSFDNVSSTLLQTIYSTSTYQPSGTSTMGPLRIVKAASTNRIDVLAYNASGYTVGQVLISTPTTLVSNTFYHIALSYNSTTRKLSLYLDGTLCNSITITAIASGLGQGCLNLGGIPFATANTGMNGKISLFRFWSSDKFSTNFDKLVYSYKLPTTDLYSDKVVVGLNFENGKIEDLKGNNFTTSGGISYYTDIDGTGALITGSTLNSGLLSSLKLTGPYCVELKYKCLSGFDFATAINSDIVFLKLVDKDGNSRFQHGICNPGVLGGSAYTFFTMRNGPSSTASPVCTNSVLVTDTVYHAMAHLDGSTYSPRSMYSKLNGINYSSSGSGPWYHHPGIEEYSLELGNTQANKGNKWVLYWVKITSGTRRYDYEFIPPAHLETFSSSGYTDVTATKGTDTLTKRLSINKQVAAEVPSIFTYDPSAAIVATDAYGWATSLPSTNMSILVGNSSDTGNWTKTVTSNNGITGTIITNSLAINTFVATNNVHVMLRGDDYNDVSEYRKTFVASASGSAFVPIVSTDWSPFGGPGNHYKLSNTTGSNNQQYIQGNITTSGMQLGTANFTYETFFSTTSDPTVSTFKVPFWHRGNTDATLYGSDFVLMYTQVEGWRAACVPNYNSAFGGGGSTAIVFTYTTAPAIVKDKTYHIAAVRSGTNIYLYINGTRYTAGSTVLTGGFSFYNTNQVAQIGFLPGGAYNSVMRFSQIRFTLGLARYTTSTITVPTEPFTSETPDSGYIDVTATKTGYNSLVKRFSVIKSKATAPTKVSAVASCSTSLITLAGDIYGAVPSFSGATATMSITIGGVNDTANWTITHTKSSVDIGTSLSGDTINITSITNVLDAGWIEFSATRNQGSWPTLTYRVSVNKTKLLTPTYPTGNTFTKADMRYNKPVSASIKFTTDGKIYTKTGTTAYSYVGNWYNPNTTSIGTGKYFRYNITGDTVTGEIVNTWVELSTDRVLTLARGMAGGTAATSITIDISTSSGGSPIVSTNYALLELDSYI